MTRDEKCKSVLRELGDTLQRATYHVVRTRRMTYKSIPFRNNLTYAGVRLEDVMVPAVPDDPTACMAIWDAWVWCLNQGMEDKKPLDAVEEFGGSALKEWLSQWDATTKQSVMLLWALGHAEGAQVEYTKTSIMVKHGEHEYGVTPEGMSKARFTDGVKVRVLDPTRVIEDGLFIRTFNAQFLAMYKEAYRCGVGPTTALVALATSHATMEIWKAILDSSLVRHPNPKMMQRVERAIFTRTDPLAYLFKTLVPEWMGSRTFTKVFGSVKKREIDLTPMQRQLLLNKLYLHFHKNKESIT